MSTENLDTETFEYTHLLELNTDVESRLSSESKENTIRLLLFENISNVFRGNGNDWSEETESVACRARARDDGELTIDFGSHLMRGLDSCDVGVDENGFNVGFLHSLDRLSACIRRG